MSASERAAQIACDREAALKVQCPECLSLPGAKCKNYKGAAKAPCKGRLDLVQPPRPCKPKLEYVQGVFFADTPTAKGGGL